jgi:asparagine synthase (glutamine-hydrolysing)
MCGIAGFLDLNSRERDARGVLSAMLTSLVHRGPDGQGMLVRGSLAMGARRLSIVDVQGSDQPLLNEDKTLALVGNGEIFNYVELRQELKSRGHVFSTEGDLEVILHLFEESGPDFVKRVNGQFSIALYDFQKNELHLFRDHFGITPLFYTANAHGIVFASEIKAILCHPGVTRAVDLSGLDQVICFPGLVSPRTMFKGIHSLRPGHRLQVCGASVTEREFWDLDYPLADSHHQNSDEGELAREFLSVFDRAVELRMRADRPVGVYLSGGLDSSFVAASMRANQPSAKIHAFSIVFPESRSIDERRFQREMVQLLGLEHVEVPFRDADIGGLLSDMVWHAECPVKESYNTCSMALAKAARGLDVPVVLGGEGADELLAGYPGYRFDSVALRAGKMETLGAEEARARGILWGDPFVRYERMYHTFGQWRRSFFSRAVLEEFEQVDVLREPPLRVDRLQGRHPINQRSYIDCKLRMTDHLLGDHGDRMAMAKSVEARFPFLDPAVFEFVRTLPPNYKVNGLDEKVLLKRAAEGRVPRSILRREKFGFRSPGSPVLLKNSPAMVDELLDSGRLRAQGYLNVEMIEELKNKHRSSGAQFNPHAEDDLLLIALTFGLFLELFKMPTLS